LSSEVPGGTGRLTASDDDRAPTKPVEDFHGVLKSSPYLDRALPGLAAHLASSPAEPLAGAEDFLYWTKEKFGIAPFISVTHVTIVPAGPHQSIATSRDVYSSRYIDGSLSTMIASDAVDDPSSFYLVYVNRSRASALRGPMPRLRRAIIEHKATAGLEKNLREIATRIGADR